MNGSSGMRDWLQKLMKNRKGTDFIVMLLMGVLVLIVAVPSKTDRQSTAEQFSSTVSTTKTQSLVRDEYVAALTEELTKLLETMEGAGSCRVMLTMEDGGKESRRVTGVVVVSEGADNAVVVSNISRAVMSLFQLDAHKITVVKMSVQEESL